MVDLLDVGKDYSFLFKHIVSSILNVRIFPIISLISDLVTFFLFSD